MGTVSKRSQQGTNRRWTAYAATGTAVTATAVAGAKAVDADSAWYRALDKPPWQPPPAAFGLVWTPLYASLAWAAGHGLNRAQDRRAGLAASLAANLALNASWNHLFFRMKNPRAGLVGITMLNLSNAQLIRRMNRVDPPAAAALVPYAAWCLFATALNFSLARRNPSQR